LLPGCRPEDPTGPPANRSPTVTIVSPADGTGFTLGASISFAGTATDPEDGPLSDGSLAWASSLDGPIGTGLAFSVDDLSAGSHIVRLTATDAEGARDSSSVVIDVIPPANRLPTASFSASCSNLTCAFTDQSTDPDGTIEARAWNFGDGATSAERDPVHTFATGGSYDVRLTATDDAGDAAEAAQVITVSPANQGPGANFATSCELLECAFTDLSVDPDGTVVTWSWSFGDGSSSTAQNPSHAYAAGGTYQVTLTVTDDEGTTGQAVRQVTANAKPTAEFSSACTGLTCTFTDESSDQGGTLVSRAWSFGDGATSAQQNPDHTYADDGTYDVRLIVVDDGGAADTASSVVTVARPNVPPVAAFAVNCPELTCAFTDQSTDADGTIASRNWTFGDGQSSSARNPSHTYAAEGQYTVSLVVTDDDGASSAPATRQITVSPANQGPTAAFTFSCVELVCQFNDGSSDPDGTIASRAWDFGDGSGSSQKNPQHAYVSGSTYAVVLTVTDNDGATDQTSKQVTVNRPPVVSIQQPTDGATRHVGETVQFSGTASDPDGDGLSLAWRSSLDGALGTGTGVSRSDLSIGTHTISFIGSDGTAADTARIQLTIVNDAPVATISAPSAGTVYRLGSTIAFGGSASDTESGPLTGAALVWTSSRDGQIGTGTSFQRSNLSAGSHLIRLVATDPHGAEDTASVDIRVNAPPSAAITAPTAGASFTEGESVAFTGSAEDPEDGSLTGPALQWESSLDGPIGAGASFARDDLAVGSHTIRLIATDFDGAADTASVTITVAEPANDPPTADFTHACTGLDCQFTDASSDPDGTVTAWSWDFGDGATSTQQSPQHTYSSAGSYTVKLVVSDDDGSDSSPAEQQVDPS
jgi:PKD repeat protein